jgi:LacI family transcriptional regulator
VVFPWSPDDGNAAFAHFAERGFRHFALCTMRSGENWGREQRLARAVAQAGAGYHFHPPPSRRPGRKRPEIVEAAWVAALPKPVGIWAVNDLQAYRILEACRLAGAAVPDDVAVLGTDDDEPLCALCSPHLSSINMHVSEIGYHAAGALDRLMSGADPMAPFIPPAEIVVRASTDTFATADPAVKSVMGFIRDHFADPIGVKHLAAHGRISRRALERGFHQAVGRSPAQEIRRIRIEHAKRLLATTNLKMPEVARHCGFANAPRFSEAFARAAGRTPSAFRREAGRGR